MWEAPPLHKLEEAIESPSSPIGMRMRAAYFLRQEYETAVRNHPTDDELDEHNGEEEEKISSSNQGSTRSVEDIVIATLEKGLIDERHGSLLRHEFAYVMGQLRDERCCEILERVLSNTSDCIMVRHECGEALGAIGALRSIPILEEAIRLSPDTPEIGQTCEIAIAFMNWKNRNSPDAVPPAIPSSSEQKQEEAPMVCACMASPYSSIDPAPPHPAHASLATSQIASILLNQNLPLFERYRAMFSLRNRGGRDCVLALGKALVEDDSSVLLRHEVAYVLGQMQDDNSLEALAESLRRVGEHAMVRHESAEALGAIEGRWEEVEVILKSFLEDDDVVVGDSCLVALDAADYWGRDEEGEKAEEEKEVTSLLDEGNLRDNTMMSPLSFVHQKAVSNGKTNYVLANHFNVSC